MRGLVSSLELMAIGAKNRFSRFKTEFRENEMGMSNVVATVVMILIVVLLCVFLYNQMSDWIQSMWSNITGNTDTIQSIE